MTPGRFITLEGGEGCGKSTQATLLAQALESAGISVVQTREPGGTPGAEAIRGLILDGDIAKWDVETELMLFFAARRDHVQRKILPAIAAGKWVVCDRFADSTLVYQVMAQGVGRQAYEQLYHIALGNFAPDLTLVLDLPVNEGLSRARRRSADADRFEQRNEAFHEAIRHGFLKRARELPQRIAVVDASGAIEAVQAEVLAVVEKQLKVKLAKVGA